MVSNWEPANSLVETAISGAEIAPRLPALAVARLPLCLRQGEGLVHSWLALLRYSLSPLPSEQARLCLIAFRMRVLSLSLWLSHSLGSYFTLAPSDCPNGIQAQSYYPKCAARVFLFSPCSLLADASIWATSPLGLAVRRIICGFFFPPVMLPSEIPKLPTDWLVRGFPAL